MKRLILGLLLARPLLACPFDFHLWLEVAPNRDSAQHFGLEIDQTMGSPIHYRFQCPGVRDREGEVSLAESGHFWQALENAGVWELRDDDDGGAEECIYYTDFDLSQGDRHQQSRWRGLGLAPERVVQVLLRQPWLKDLTLGLDWAQSQKSRPQREE
ncbi:MAG: hypothetical protein U0931_36225 [Vulcanimicrobiota bacterium]